MYYVLQLPLQDSDGLFIPLGSDCDVLLHQLEQTNINSWLLYLPQTIQCGNPAGAFMHSCIQSRALMLSI
jgi:hypothetical protein